MLQYMNETLTRAWKGAYEGGWDLWVATDNYNDAPKHRDDNELPVGSEPPISSDYHSPFIGKTLEECAKWLQGAPDDVALHKTYFTALDEHSKEDDTVMMCRIVESKGEGEVKLEYFPLETDTIQMYIATSDGLKFDERALNYQRQRMQDGKPDRSKAGPYQ